MKEKPRNMVMHLYMNTPMYNSHDGLAVIAKKENGVDVKALKVGQFCLFINPPCTACKLFAANNVILYYKHPKGHRLNPQALQMIPQFFDGQDIGYNKALAKIIKTEFEERFGKK